MNIKEIKENLLSTNMFINNKYLDKYCELMYNNLGTIQEKFRTQKHHMIPIVCYKVKYGCNNRQEAEVFSKEGKYKYIYHYELEEYLKEGYIKGIGVPMKGTSGKTWINKEGKEAYCNNENLEEYLLNGWVKGRVKRKK